MYLSLWFLHFLLLFMMDNLMLDKLICFQVCWFCLLFRYPLSPSGEFFTLFLKLSNSWIYICMFFITSFSLLIFPICWDIVLIVLSFYSLDFFLRLLNISKLSYLRSLSHKSVIWLRAVSVLCFFSFAWVLFLWIHHLFFFLRFWKMCILILWQVWKSAYYFLSLEFIGVILLFALWL